MSVAAAGQCPVVLPFCLSRAEPCIHTQSIQYQPLTSQGKGTGEQIIKGTSLKSLLMNVESK